MQYLQCDLSSYSIIYEVEINKDNCHIEILSPPPRKWRTGICILPGLALISIKSFFEDNRSLPPNEKLSIWNVTTSIYRYKFYIGQEFLINSEYELKLLLLSSINSKGLTIVHICYNFKMHYTDQQNLL